MKFKKRTLDTLDEHLTLGSWNLSTPFVFVISTTFKHSLIDQIKRTGILYTQAHRMKGMHRSNDRQIHITCNSKQKSTVRISPQGSCHKGHMEMFVVKPFGI